MEAIDTHIETLRKEAQELDALNTKVKGNTAMIKLLEVVQDTVEELLDGQEKMMDREYFDKDLGTTIAKAVTEAITAFAKTPPAKVTVTPQINVDLKPVADAISGQNKTIISLLEKVSNGDNSGELYRLITAMVGKNNAFIEKGFQQINYKDDFSKLIDAVKGRELVKMKVERTFNGVMEVIPEYKK